MVNCSGRVAPRATREGNVESSPSFGRDPSEDAVPRPAADAWTTSKAATANQNAAFVARRTSRSLTGATTVSDAVARARRNRRLSARSKSSRRHCRDRRRAPDRHPSVASTAPSRNSGTGGSPAAAHCAAVEPDRSSPAQATPRCPGIGGIPRHPVRAQVKPQVDPPSMR